MLAEPESGLCHATEKNETKPGCRDREVCPRVRSLSVTPARRTNISCVRAVKASRPARRAGHARGERHGWARSARPKTRPARAFPSRPPASYIYSETVTSVFIFWRLCAQIDTEPSGSIRVIQQIKRVYGGRGRLGARTIFHEKQ